MEKRIGSALILVETHNNVGVLNQIRSKFCHIILARQGVPLHDRNINIISIVLEGTTDEIGALTGQIGKLQGIKIKSTLLKAE